MLLPNQKYTFRKSEKLKSKKRIEELFRIGQFLKKYPVRVVYIPKSIGEHTQCAFSVPKKLFKKAVDRNIIKRKIREAYRLNKHIIASTHIDMMIIYTGREIEEYHKIEKAVIQLLHALLVQVQR